MAREVKIIVAGASGGEEALLLVSVPGLLRLGEETRLREGVRRKAGRKKK